MKNKRVPRRFIHGKPISFQDDQDKGFIAGLPAFTLPKVPPGWTDIPEAVRRRVCVYVWWNVIIGAD